MPTRVFIVGTDPIPRVASPSSHRTQKVRIKLQEIIPGVLVTDAGSIEPSNPLGLQVKSQMIRALIELINLYLAISGQIISKHYEIIIGSCYEE